MKHYHLAVMGSLTLGSFNCAWIDELRYTPNPYRFNPLILDPLAEEETKGVFFKRELPDEIGRVNVYTLCRKYRRVAPTGKFIYIGTPKQQVRFSHVQDY